MKEHRVADFSLTPSFPLWQLVRWKQEPEVAVVVGVSWLNETEAQEHGDAVPGYNYEINYVGHRGRVLVAQADLTAVQEVMA